MNPDIESLPLRDIHLPDAVSWWPPAPGWWIVAGLLIFLPLLALYLRRRARRKQLVRDATRYFNALISDYRQHLDSKIFLHELSIFLRRVSISAYPGQDIAGLTGEQWLRFLDAMRKSKSGTINFNSNTGRHLLVAPYRQAVDVGHDEIENLISATRSWIRSLTSVRNEIVTNKVATNKISTNGIAKTSVLIAGGADVKN